MIVNNDVAGGHERHVPWISPASAVRERGEEGECAAVRPAAVLRAAVNLVAVAFQEGSWIWQQEGGQHLGLQIHQS